MKKEIQIPVDKVILTGLLAVPKETYGLILFVHGSGSSRFSPRNNFVADHLNQGRFATLLIDLLSEQEDSHYETRFDISLLTKRVVSIIEWLKKNEELKELPLGLFGASTGAAAALKAAAQKPDAVKAVVSRGGRPDLAKEALAQVKAPTLLIVGGADFQVIELNEGAYQELHCPKNLEIVPGATHLFEEPGCLLKVAQLAEKWFTLKGMARQSPITTTSEQTNI